MAIVRDQPPVGVALREAEDWRKAVEKASLGGAKRASTAEVIAARYGVQTANSYSFRQKRSVHVRQLRKAAYAEFFHGEWAGNRWEWWSIAAAQPCRVYWGSHGCQLSRDHEGPHLCSCADTPPAEGGVGKPPYYGDITRFYGEDAERLGLPLVEPEPVRYGMEQERADA
jgi:hypothetical protein